LKAIVQDKAGPGSHAVVFRRLTTSDQWLAICSRLGDLFHAHLFAAVNSIEPDHQPGAAVQRPDNVIADASTALSSAPPRRLIPAHPEVVPNYAATKLSRSIGRRGSKPAVMKNKSPIRYLSEI